MLPKSDILFELGFGDAEVRQRLSHDLTQRARMICADAGFIATNSSHGLSILLTDDESGLTTTRIEIAGENLLLSDSFAAVHELSRTQAAELGFAEPSVDFGMRIVSAPIRALEPAPFASLCFILRSSPMLLTGQRRAVRTAALAYDRFLTRRMQGREQRLPTAASGRFWDDDFEPFLRITRSAGVPVTTAILQLHHRQGESRHLRLPDAFTTMSELLYVLRPLLENTRVVKARHMLSDLVVVIAEMDRERRMALYQNAREAMLAVRKDDRIDITMTAREVAYPTADALLQRGRNGFLVDLLNAPVALKPGDTVQPEGVDGTASAGPSLKE